jgi:hypothetical protein
VLVYSIFPKTESTLFSSRNNGFGDQSSRKGRDLAIIQLGENSILNSQLVRHRPFRARVECEHL